MPPSPAAYPLLEILGDSELLDRASALIFDHGCLGTELMSERNVLRAFFVRGTNVAPLAETLRRTLGVRVLIPPPLADRDWLLDWKNSIEGFALGEKFYVLPTWLPVPSTGRDILRIDPEQAFGLGTHDTTRLSVELLERYLIRGLKVLDLGTGSGILAMVAARLGSTSVLAVDSDPDACACARSNVSRNRLDAAVHVQCASWEELPHLESDVVIANINATVLARAVPHMQAKLVFLSGLLIEEADELALALPRRFRAAQMWSAGEWVALVSRAQ